MRFSWVFAIVAASPFVAMAEEPIFAPGAKLKVEAEKGSAGEGPAWDPMLGVLTSGRGGSGRGGIHRLSIDGQTSIYREKAGTNGLLFDRQGRLVCCEPVLRRVTRRARPASFRRRGQSRHRLRIRRRIARRPPILFR